MTHAALAALALLIAGCNDQPPEQLAAKWAAQMGYRVEAINCYGGHCSVRLAGVPQPLALLCRVDYCVQPVSR